MMIKLKKHTLMKIFNDYPHEFKLLLVGKDGEVKLNTNNDLREVFSLIDTMPMRKRKTQIEKC